MVNPSPSTERKPLSGTGLILIILAVVLSIALSAFGFHELQMADPYIRQVMAQEGDPDQGQMIFSLNCAACHGADATGLVGPSLENVSHRKSQMGLIRQVISGKTPPMPKFQPSPEIMADLLSYLDSL